MQDDLFQSLLKSGGNAGSTPQAQQPAPGPGSQAPKQPGPMTYRPQQQADPVASYLPQPAAGGFGGPSNQFRGPSPTSSGSNSLEQLKQEVTAAIQQSVAMIGCPPGFVDQKLQKMLARIDREGESFRPRIEAQIWMLRMQAQNMQAEKLADAREDAMFMPGGGGYPPGGGGGYYGGAVYGGFSPYGGFGPFGGNGG